MSKIKGFHHTAIRSADFDRSVAFYTGVLEMKIKITWGEKPNRAVMIDVGDGNYVEIFERAPTESKESPESPILHFALRTDNCNEVLELVRAANMKVTMEPTDIDISSTIGTVPVRIAFFEGPDGEVIELFENKLL